MINKWNEKVYIWNTCYFWWLFINLIAISCKKDPHQAFLSLIELSINNPLPTHSLSLIKLLRRFVRQRKRCRGIHRDLSGFRILRWFWSLASWGVCHSPTALSFTLYPYSTSFWWLVTNPVLKKYKGSGI